MDHNQHHAGAHTWRLRRRRRREPMEEGKPPGESPKGRSCQATWRRLGPRNSRTSRIGTNGAAAARKGNPIPFRPKSRVPTRRDIANTTAEHLWLDLKPAQKGHHGLHKRQAPTFNCYTPPKHQPSPDGASKEDTTHQAPPPPILLRRRRCRSRRSFV